MQIRIVPIEERQAWTTLEQWLRVFKPEEVVEMLQRYQDAQKHHQTYRQRSQAAQQLMKQYVRQQVEKRGQTVEQLLKGEKHDEK